MIILCIAVIIFVIVFAEKDYRSTTYHEATRNPSLSVLFDPGRLGEYLISRNLQSIERMGAKLLYNLYIPKADGGTTEIDVLMIHTKGIFVFESKNYSGWIFGNDKQQYWTQSLPAGRGRSHKEKFFNPVAQNAGHIRHLKTLLGNTIPMFSIVVFSERCELKKITLSDPAVRVIKRNQVFDTVADICSRTEQKALTLEQVQQIYDKLYPCTQVSQKTKEQHIDTIKSKK